RLPGISFPRIAVLGGAAAATVAVLVAVSLGTHGSGSPRGSATSAAESSARAAPPAPAPRPGPRGAGRSAAPSPAAPTAAAPAAAPRASGPRHVERSASITLAAARNKLESVANEIVAVVDRHHGYVLHSSVTSGAGGGGSFDLRVPVGSLQATLSDLSGLA